MVVFAQSPDDVAMKIIVENCLDCHSGAKPKGGLDLSTRENLLKGGVVAQRRIDMRCKRIERVVTGHYTQHQQHVA